MGFYHGVYKSHDKVIANDFGRSLWDGDGEVFVIQLANSHYKLSGSTSIYELYDYMYKDQVSFAVVKS